MAECINYNCDELPEYEQTIAECAAYIRNAGASVFGLLECGSEILDPSDAVEVQALIDAGTLTMIPNVKFGFNDPAEITTPSTTSCGTPKITNYTQSATAEDYKVTIDNTTFWNTAKKRSFAGLLIFQCETNGLTPLVTFVDAEISVSAFKKSSNTSDEPQFYQIGFSWKDIDIPLDYTAPVVTY